MSEKSLSPLINCPAGYAGAYTIPDGVTSISDRAFADCKSLTSIIIPDSVTSIGDEAFRCCSALTSVTIPGSVTSIGGDAFRECTSLTNINVHSLNRYYASIDGVLFNNDLTVMIKCPAGFSGAYSVPDSVTTIGKWAFSDCSALTNINVHPDNMYYASVDGVLLNKERTVLIKCPAGFSGACTVPDSVTAISNGAFFKCRSISAVTIPDGVSSIGEATFFGCSALASVTIPDGVTSIGDYAFYKCQSLASVTIPDSVTSIGDEAFTDCTSLASVTIGNGVISIGYRAFCGCCALTSVTIPDGATSIGNEAFIGCSALTSAILPDSDTYIGYRAFYGCTSLASVTIPDSVTRIGNAAFSDCHSLTSVTIGNSVTSIGESAFCNCHSLASVTIPDSVTRIGKAAFSDCHSLTCVIIGNSVTSIGESAFCDCHSLASVTIPASVTSIGDNAFSDCSALTNINVHPNNMNYASVDGVLFNKERTFLIQCPCCSSLSSVAIPDCVTSIGDHAFYYCSALTSVTIPDGVTSIGDAAFFGCAALASVTIPASVTSIGDNAFSDCSALTNINVHPDNMNYASVDGVLVKIEVFELTDEDAVAIEIAKNVARRFLKNPQITPKQVIALGNALYALERLPFVTPGVATEFGIEYRAGTKEYSEMRYIDFRISESEFEISKGGSVYDKASGSDSYSDPGWTVGTYGHGENECDLHNLEESIDEYLNLGAKLSISDESEIKYE